MNKFKFVFIIALTLVVQTLIFSSAQAQLLSNSSEARRLTYDLGISAGSIGDESYTEVQLGLNWFLQDWFAWRNAAFYRVIEGDDDYGLDTSARLFHFFNWGERSGATLFGGPGYRFASEGDHLPFVEGGVVLKLGGLAIGGGVKSFLPDLIGSNQESDTQFFIILSGAGAL